MPKLFGFVINRKSYSDGNNNFVRKAFVEKLPHLASQLIWMGQGNEKMSGMFRFVLKNQTNYSQAKKAEALSIKAQGDTSNLLTNPKAADILNIDTATNCFVGYSVDTEAKSPLLFEGVQHDNNIISLAIKSRDLYNELEKIKVIDPTIMNKIAALPREEITSSKILSLLISSGIKTDNRWEVKKVIGRLYNEFRAIIPPSPFFISNLKSSEDFYICGTKSTPIWCCFLREKAADNSIKVELALFSSDFEMLESAIEILGPNTIEITGTLVSHGQPIVIETSTVKEFPAEHLTMRPPLMWE